MKGQRTSAPPNSLTLTLPEVGAELRLSDDAVRSMIARGELPAVRIGAHHALRVRRTDLEQYVARLETTMQHGDVLLRGQTALEGR